MRKMKGVGAWIMGVFKWGISTPVNDRIVAMVHEIEAGTRKITVENFHDPGIIERRSSSPANPNRHQYPQLHLHPVHVSIISRPVMRVIFIQNRRFDLLHGLTLLIGPDSRQCWRLFAVK